jgi:membrane protease YdiL (CAAX protease family)
MPLLAIHLVAAYAVLAAPWLAWWSYQRAKRKIESGTPDAKLQLYRAIVTEQVVSTAVILMICRLSQISAAKLGLASPRYLGWNLAALVVLIGLLVRSALRLRKKADKVRKKLEDFAGAIVPRTQPERAWFGAVSVGAGVSEEILFRGFLLYYLATVAPSMNLVLKVLLVSVVFGVGHIYQGWRGVLSTGIVGAFMAIVYVLTGSLLVPIVLHAVIDWRVLWMLPPEQPHAAPEAVLV